MPTYVLRYRAEDALEVHLGIAGLASYGTPWQIREAGDLVEYVGDDERIMTAVKRLTIRWLVDATSHD